MSKTYMRAPTGEVFETSNPEYHKECENLGHGTKGYAARREYACKELRKMIKPGQKVFCILRDVSKSGMSRNISLYVVHKGELRNIDVLASDATAIALAKNQGIRMGGCGMDLGFSLVYNLGAALWPKGTGKPHGTRNGQPDNAGGYAIKHEWL